MSITPIPEILYGRRRTRAVYQTAQECRGCGVMHFVFANTWGKTLCLECDDKGAARENRAGTAAAASARVSRLPSTTVQAASGRMDALTQKEDE